jgi:Cellulase (glycosyl hydrolase family 5)
VIIGGLDWAYDLSGVPAHRIVGHNIAYATHPYNTPQRQPAAWDRSWGSLAGTDPVIVTEFGNLNDTSCSTDYPSKVIRYADERAAGWVAWAWYPGGCTFPALIEDWSGAPSALGLVVRDALLSHGGPHPVVEPEEETPLRYTFDSGVETWALNDYVDPDYTNLGGETPEGAEPATLTYVSDDGAPTPGSLELRVKISAIDQYVIAQTQVARNLTGKTLRARVKLQAGSLNGLPVWLHACTGATFVCAQGGSVDPTPTPGEWLSLEWDLATVTTPGFDVTKVISLGVTVDATVNADGTPRVDALSAPSEATLRIDTFTE